MIWTADRNGNAGHPTKRFDLVRKLRKQGKIKIIGGGGSGKPPVVVFLSKEFDFTKTTEKRFLIALDPGYRYIGFAVCEVRDGKLIVFCKGTLETRISDIKLSMTKRRSYRKRRRNLSRYKKKRLSAKQGRVLTKFKKPRNVRSNKKTNATLTHGVETHLNLYFKLLKLFSLPASQTQFVIENNVFDIRAMTWGKTNGNGYQTTPRQTVYEEKCFICSTTNELQVHHLIPRKRGGTELPENKIYLCTSCHCDIHAGRIYLPVKGIAQWRELGTMNAIMGVLRKVPSLNFVPVSALISKRLQFSLDKTHANDALLTAAAFSNTVEIDISTGYYLELTKFRRHTRARVHAHRDRLYKLDGAIIARNRQRRTDQKGPSLAEVSIPATDRPRLRVYPGLNVLKPFRAKIPAIGGDIFQYTGHRFIATGVTSGKYIYSPDLKEIRRVLRNEGIVCARLSSPA
jgi:5-methylcytosine-specific restriction endonuclease McrA